MNSETLQFSFHFTSEDSPLIECCLEDLALSLWFPEEGVISGIFAAKDKAAVTERLTRLYAHMKKPLPAMEFSHPDQTDWLTEQYLSLPPIEVERFFIYGPHHECKVPDGKIGLEIESAHAFGSGHHPTTSTCLKVLQELSDKKIKKGLDVGCGSGILALAMACLWPEASVIGCDCDPESVKTALNNAHKNHRLCFILSEGLNHATIQEQAPYDLIAANIHSEILNEIAPQIMQSLSSEGRVLLSGMTEEQAHSVIETYSQYGGHLEKTHSLDHWTTLLLRRSSNSPILTSS